jgi:hypothetical protein
MSLIQGCSSMYFSYSMWADKCSLLSVEYVTYNVLQTIKVS